MSKACILMIGSQIIPQFQGSFLPSFLPRSMDGCSTIDNKYDTIFKDVDSLSLDFVDTFDLSIRYRNNRYLCRSWKHKRRLIFYFYFVY